MPTLPIYKLTKTIEAFRCGLPAFGQLLLLGVRWIAVERDLAVLRPTARRFAARVISIRKSDVRAAVSMHQFPQRIRSFHRHQEVRENLMSRNSAVAR